MNGIGLMLRGAREENGVSLEEASEDLKVTPAILYNIEEGNMGCFKDIFILKDYIKDYAKYLGIDPTKTVDKFNEFMFEKTSKIPVEEIEKQIIAKNREEALLKSRVASPYTDSSSCYKKKSIFVLYLLVIILVALAIFWSVKKITIGRSVTTSVSEIR